MNIIIIGDKYQKGMKSKGCPALIKSKDYSSIIEHQYSILKNFFPNSKIVYIAGFEFKKIQFFLEDHKELAVDLVHNYNYENYNDIYSLSLASKYFSSDVLITFGYNILKHSMFKHFNSDRGSQIFIDNTSNSNIGCVVQNDTVSNITYDLPNSISHLYYLSKTDANRIRYYIQDSKYQNYFLFEILNNLIDQNIKIHPHYTNNKSIKGFYGYNKIK